MSSRTVSDRPARHRAPRWQAPLLAPLLARRELTALLAGAGLLVLMLHQLGVVAWRCPLRGALSLPCPGCGLTRSAGALLGGDWSRALELHAFGPLALLLGAVAAAGALLPARWRAPLADGVAELERRTGITLILAGAFLAYWVARLVLDLNGFDSLG